jgi:hypothetical protein
MIQRSSARLDRRRRLLWQNLKRLALFGHAALLFVMVITFWFNQDKANMNWPADDMLFQ